ncbi:hypothetical protein PG996_003810 [Apiospora saccharicola]|uniref:Uncharacterized protein n=1 Tax=Apiospora saccharicola TaxID=335842 RepID=A0ABR1W2C9_9PEZI
MASPFQGWSSANTFSLRAPATILSPENGHLVFNKLPNLRGTPLVKLLDFLNVHFDSLRRILHPDSVDGPEAAAAFPDGNSYEELRNDIIQLLDEILGPRAFELFFEPESPHAGDYWDALMSGVNEKMANSENHARWSKLIPHKLYALLPGSGLNYSFAQPGHAEANIGYGLPEWMTRAVQRSPEIQSRADSNEDLSIYRPRPEDDDDDDDDELNDWAEYLRELREEIRPTLGERNPSQANLHLVGNSIVDTIDHFTDLAISPHRRAERQPHRQRQRAHSFDLHTPSRSAQDPRDRQTGHDAFTGLLFGHSIPSVAIDFPDHARLLGHIHDEDLEWESKMWPSSEADQYQERFAYGSTTLSGALSYLTEMSKLPQDLFTQVEDVTHEMGYRYLQEHLGGPLYQESRANYLIILTNVCIANQRYSRNAHATKEMEKFLGKARNCFWDMLGIQECSPEHTTPALRKCPGQRNAGSSSRACTRHTPSSRSIP